MSCKIIDTSHHQENINFNDVKNDGISGAIIKATEGVNYIDPCFKTNISNAIKAGLTVGVYHFLRSTSIEQQCNDFLNVIKPYKITCVAIDVENPYHNGKCIPEISNLGKSGIMQRILYFAKFMRQHGYDNILCYSSKSWFGTYIDVNQLKVNNIGIWLAWYSSAIPENTNHSSICDIWQYASDGNVKGIKGHVDINVCYKSFNNTKVIIDTTVLKLPPNGVQYQFKVTSNNKPVFTSGNSSIVTNPVLVKQQGNDYYYTVISKNIGTVGMYVNGKRKCIVYVKNYPVISDTPSNLNMVCGSTYQFKLTSECKPVFSSAHNNILKPIFVKQQGNNYFFKIQALQKTNGCGIYANGKRICVVVVK